MDDRWIYQIEFTPETRFLTPMLTDFGLQVLEATSTPAGWHLRVHTATRRVIEEFIEACSRQGVACHLESVYSPSVEAQAVLQEKRALRLTDRQRKVVFEPGYSTTSGNTGLGLDIIQQSARAHRWRVQVAEAATGGARFEFHGADVNVDASEEPGEST